MAIKNIYSFILSMLLLFTSCSSNENTNSVDFSTFPDVKVTEIARLGDATAEYAFGEWGIDIFITDANEIIASDSENGIVSIFSINGDLIDTLIYKGSGPAEVEELGSFHVFGNQLIVMDRARQKTMVMDKESKEVINQSALPNLGGLGFLTEYISTPVVELGIVSGNSFSTNPNDEPDTREFKVVSFSGAEQKPVVVAHFPSMRMYVERDGNSVSASTIPFSTTTQFAFDLKNNRILVAQTGSLRVKAYALEHASDSLKFQNSGRELVSKEIQPHELTRDDIVAKFVQWKEDWGDDYNDAWGKSMMAKMSFPEVRPVLNSLLIVDGDQILVSYYETENDLRPYWKFDAEGNESDRFLLPKKWEVKAMKNNVLVVSFKDENGFEVLSINQLN